MLLSLFAPLAGPIAPRRVLGRDADGPSPLLALLGLAVTTAASALLLVPFMRAAVEASALLVDTAMAKQVILLNTLVLGPLGACASALVTGVLLWIVPVVAGHETRLRRCIVVGAVVGGVEVARRVFIAAVLWLREMAGRVDPQYEVRTGLDAVLVALPDLPTALLVIAGHLGPFEIWAVVVATIGLAALERMPRPIAAWAAVVTFAATHGLAAALEILR